MKMISILWLHLVWICQFFKDIVMMKIEDKHPFIRIRLITYMCCVCMYVILFISVKINGKSCKDCSQVLYIDT